MAVSETRHVPVAPSVVGPARNKLRKIVVLQERVLVKSENRIEPLKKRVDLKDPVSGPLKLEAHSCVSIPHLVEHASEDRQE